MEVIAILVSVASSLVTIAGVIAALFYWGGSQSKTLEGVKEDVSELKEELKDLGQKLQPQSATIATLQSVVEQTVDAVRGLQETIRGDFSRRLTAVEMDVREILTRCKERGHVA